MKRKVLLEAAMACILTAVMLGLAILPVQPVQANGGVVLRPPFDGTYRVTSYFDHENPNYGDNNYIWIYNGERRPANSQNDNPPCTGNPYPYDGHDGWDWSMVTGIDVLAAAAGQVVISQNDYGGYGHTIIIAHDNGYYTMYSHLSQRLVISGALVTAGQHIAESGSSGTTAAHLHFGVRQGGYANTNYAVDPFGWRGTERDPLFNHNGKVSTCLWRSRDEDSISCADTIVEDAGAGAVAYFGDNWQVSNRGNGYHTFYRSNTATQSDYHTWSTSALPSPLRSGPCTVSVFVPEDPDGSGGLSLSQQVTYYIWTASGWQQAGPVNQSANVNRWVPLGTYWLADHGEAATWAYTGESTGTRWVAADALRWRQYHAFLPLILNNYCSLHYGQLIVNGDFSTGDATGWKVNRSNGSDLIVQPYGSYEYGAWMGRYNSNQDQMYQFACPATPADYASFSFRWWMSTEETNTTTDYDFLYVRIRDANGNLLQTLKTLTNRSPAGDPWHYEFFDLRAYTGQTIRISFEATTDGSLRTNFWLDEVGFFVAD